jgi:hypothetical protein
VGTALEASAIGAVADEAEGRVDVQREQASEREQHVVRPLDGGHASDPADHERVRADAEDAPDLATRDPVELDTFTNLDAEAEDGELLRRSHAESDEVVAHLGADRDEHRRPPCERPLQDAERRRRRTAEVATQHVAVERVHDHRGAGRPRGESRDASDRARLGGVRVEDRRSLATDERGKPDDRAQVAQGGDLAVQLVQRDDRDAALPRDLRHRFLAAGERARDERRVVAAGREALRQIGDVQRRASDVQPRDHAQHLDARIGGLRQADAHIASIVRRNPSRRSTAGS